MGTTRSPTFMVVVMLLAYITQASVITSRNDASDVTEGASDVTKGASDVIEDASNFTSVTSTGKLNRFVVYDEIEKQDIVDDIDNQDGVSEIKNQDGVFELENQDGVFGSEYDYFPRSSGKPNNRPVIGILSQQPSRSMRRALTKNNYHNVASYIAASYVKSVEASGARVVPILTDQSPEYYKKLSASLNGIVFPGGWVSITSKSGYGRAGDTLYQMNLAANDAGIMTPLWATGQGFWMVCYLAAQRVMPLKRCSANNRADPLIMQPGWSESQLFGGASSNLMEAAQTKKITYNTHTACVLPKTFDKLGINKDYRILSTSFDNKRVKYVSTIEHKRYPIFGSQWHPENAAYEWLYRSSIPHSIDAIDLEHHTTRVFIEAARQNHNKFDNEDEIESYLIYNYAPIYVQQLYKSPFQQVYIFMDNEVVPVVHLTSN